MPRRLPLCDVAGGTAVKYWLHYTLVALAWLGAVPLTACWIYRCLLQALLTRGESARRKLQPATESRRHPP
ncbi:E3 ubiquitin-protein ligase MARCH6 [Zootermopsis nevadensis]|uniref:RING-type E3 ubiquitin transferase n=1 Tax=Zootermopsis nevadensis TaxID=136037 RepID=A0A067RAT9_ZOONE|nr:E3 ubiquitin-protein ligase MARCH6 [Zootermopsis nevadensis]